MKNRRTKFNKFILMKKFKDLQSGDIIYYYDHCTMKPRTVEKIEWEEQHNYKYLLIYCVNGKTPVKIFCTWNHGDTAYSSTYFSCREAAEYWLNNLKRYRERRIERAKYLIDKETVILNKYKFND
jgi:hypothetical protein